MKSIIALVGLVSAVPANAAELISNNTFSVGESSVTLTAPATGGQSAAAGWYLWNNTEAVTTSSLVSDFAGRANVLHVTTTGAYNGAVQVFDGSAHVGYADVWVQSGNALYLAAFDGDILQVSATTTTGAWERVYLDTGSVSFSEVTLYSGNGGADFYVASASASDREARLQPLSAAVPEPATWAMMVFGFGALGYALRRRPTSGARVRFC